MARYDFECKKCNCVYEEMIAYDKTGKYSGVKCPSCGSKSKTKLMTTCGYKFNQPEGTDRFTSDSGGHGYRFNHNLPNVIAQRQAAEEHAAGVQPYQQIDDLNCDTSWGEQ